MNKGYLVEDCYYLTPTKVDRSFQRFKKIGAPLDPERPDINYQWENECLVVIVAGNAPQRIETEDVETAVAYRTYFVCPGCEKRAYKLYLPPNGHEFKCGARTCHGLRYTITTINKTSLHGKMLYSMNRMHKLSKQREKMGTILYNGKYTRKFQSFLRQCARAGYTKAVEDAAGLMKALKEFQRI